MKKIRMRSFLFVISSALAVSGCGGSGAVNVGSFEAMSLPTPSFQDSIGSDSRTPLENMPPAGSATYVGIMGLESSYISLPASVSRSASIAEVEGRAASIVDVRLNSDLIITVNFRNSSVSGTATNFRSYDPNFSLNGQLEISGQVTENTFGGVISGNMIESVNGVDSSGSMTGAMVGEFLGQSAGEIGGSGFVSPNFGVLAGQDISLEFTGSKQ